MINNMMYLGKRNDNWFGVQVQSVSYVYDNEYMTEQQIIDMFRDVEDCSWMFDLYCDTEDVGIEDMLGWLKKNKYVIVREFKMVN
jgi:hypothetical protein